MEFVLIPAGTFVMGTERPKPVDEQRYVTHIRIGVGVFVTGICALLAMLAVVLTRAIREKHPPQVSLARLLVLALIAGIGLLGGLHWRHWAKALDRARAEYAAACERFQKCLSCEKPAHEVRLTSPFYLGKFEVTEYQYGILAKSGLATTCAGDRPAEGVSWRDAWEWCRKASQVSGVTLRLPTEAEWEFACGTGLRSALASDGERRDIRTGAWTAENSGGRSQPVGLKAANEWGIHDILGNVSELVADFWGSYESGLQVDPRGPDVGPGRVFRGGCYDDWAIECTPTERGAQGERDRARGIGFRTVLVLEGDEAQRQTK
jgi:formylglycine-generating enzyme required for sulfatase activity